MASNKQAPAAGQPSPNRRAQLQEQRAQAAQRQRRTRAAVVIVIVVVVLAVLAGVIWWQARPAPSPAETTAPAASASPTAAATTPASATAGPATSSIFIPPDGTAETGYIEIKSPDAKPDAIVVDEHSDYQCPICKLTINLYADSFKQLIDRGDIIMRFHVRSFLDTNLKNDSSTRSAMAATCADTVGHFLDYHDVLFANQPEEGVGYTDQELRVDFATQAGITGDDLTSFQQCYDSGQTRDYVQAMEEVNSTSRTINGADQDPPGGTPAFYADGKLFTVGQLVLTDGSSYFPAYDSADAFLTVLGDVASGKEVAEG